MKSKNVAFYSAVGEKINPNLVDCLTVLLQNTGHIYGTRLAWTINCPFVRFAVAYVCGSGKERHF